ncbi:Hypothetical protein, putative [Bodo saltans]|uniref:Uncharacterized protein n=1 Tax=Bodo saltans TaxID=75058 RepID=A0A0S4JNS7_BODSA|nr:Hypothetical protein, putative [Bodo saltans]|eukprot:CUG93196.1 Hypothetical protein, putative [Bodo saltans]
MLSRRRVILRGDSDKDFVELQLMDCIGRSKFIKMLYESSAPEEAMTNAISSSSEEQLPPFEVSTTGEHIVTDLPVLHAIQKYLEFYGPSSKLPPNERGASVASVAPSVIPTPLPGELRNYISSWELAFINDTLLVDQDPWQNTKLIYVLSVAVRLGIESLQQLLSSWCADQIVTLSKGKSSMEAAEAVRSFFGLPNEWNAEESQNLEKEMEYFDSLNHRR